MLVNQIPKTTFGITEPQAINQALTIASTMSLTPQELDLQEKKLRWLSDQKANLARAEQAEREAERAVRENAKAQQMAQEAFEKANQAEAEKQAALEKATNAENVTKLQIARQMLQANADIAFIKQVTGLKKAEITRLKE